MPEAESGQPSTDDLSVPEAAEALGFHPRYGYQLVHSGALPAFRHPRTGQYRVRQSDVERFGGRIRRPSQRRRQPTDSTFESLLRDLLERVICLEGKVGDRREHPAGGSRPGRDEPQRLDGPAATDDWKRQALRYRSALSELLAATDLFQHVYEEERAATEAVQTALAHQRRADMLLQRMVAAHRSALSQLTGPADPDELIDLTGRPQPPDEPGSS